MKYTNGYYQSGSTVTYVEGDTVTELYEQLGKGDVDGLFDQRESDTFRRDCEQATEQLRNPFTEMVYLGPAWSDVEENYEDS